jgi:putative ABC transport system permease protein
MVGYDACTYHLVIKAFVMMDVHETLAVAIDALRSNKLRTILTALGVIIGSASIVLVVTVALTSQKFVVGQIEAIGSNLLWVELVGSSDKAVPQSYEMTLDDLVEVKNSIPGVVEVAGIRELPMSVVVNASSVPVNLIGVTEGYQTIRRLIIPRGRYFDSVDMEMHSKVCLITQILAKRAFAMENPINRTIRMGELTFTVIGVFRERVSTFGQTEIQDNTVIIPFTLMKYYTGTAIVRSMNVEAAMPEDVPLVERRLGQLLNSRHPANAEYKVQTLVAILSAARNISLALTIVLLIIAFISLLISGVGIMNIMLVTVTQRTREIGIRKAIGARPRDIMYQFLIEALLISGGGAVIGILMGLLVPLIAQFFLPGDLRLPISNVSLVLAFAASCFTGLFFGYLPAAQAAKLHPIDSLRYE